MITNNTTIVIISYRVYITIIINITIRTTIIIITKRLKIKLIDSFNNLQYLDLLLLNIKLRQDKKILDIVNNIQIAYL